MFDSFNPKKNDLFWVNWLFVLTALIIIWKYRASGAFWMGIFAFFIIGTRMTAKCTGTPVNSPVPLTPAPAPAA